MRVSNSLDWKDGNAYVEAREFERISDAINGAFTTPQKLRTNIQLVWVPNEVYQQTQNFEIAPDPHIDSTFLSRNGTFDRDSKNYLLIDNSEEKKTDMHINTEYEQFNDSPNAHLRIRNSDANKQKENKNNIFNYLFGFDDIINQNNQNRIVIPEEEEDFKIEAIHTYSPKLSKIKSEQCLVNFQDSINSQYESSKKFQQFQRELQKDLGIH